MKSLSSSNKGVGQLMNTSSIARQLANGKGSINRSITNVVLSSEISSTNENGSTNSTKSKHEYSLLFFLALCELLCFCSTVAFVILFTFRTLAIFLLTA